MTNLKSKKLSFHDLVPDFLREVCPEPDLAQVRTVYDGPTHQPTVTYTMTWFDDFGTEGAVRNTVAKYLKRMERGENEEEKEEEPPLLKLSQSHTNYYAGGPPEPVELMCDGPCKREFPSNQLNSIGRCGHYLCNACFGIVQNSDGTNGCSSKSCFWRGSREKSDKCYETEICQKQRERARAMKSQGIDVSSAGSISESSSETEVNMPHSVRVKLAVLYQDETYGVVHNINEMMTPSTTLVGDVILALMKKGKQTDKRPEQRMKHGRFYLVGEGGLKDVQRIHKSPTYKLQLKELVKSGNSIRFILDMDDCIKKNAFLLG